jgi:hypothetical protein
VTAGEVANQEPVDRFWWAHDASENVFFEITREVDRSDLGRFLNAPLTARGGVATGAYVLVPHVNHGDIVIHYDSDLRQIIAVSRAAKYWRHDGMFRYKMTADVAFWWRVSRGRPSG